MLWDKCKTASAEILREARLSQIKATVGERRARNKSETVRKRARAAKKSTNEQALTAIKQAAGEGTTRKLTRNTKGKGRARPQEGSSDQEAMSDEDSHDNFSSSSEESAPDTLNDPLKKSSSGKFKTSATIAPYSLHPDDPAAFLKLAAFLNIFLAERITEHQLRSADSLVRSYCKDLIRVCPRSAWVFMLTNTSFYFICSYMDRM